MTIGNTSSTQSSTLPVVHLRAMEPEDLDFLYDIENDTNVWQVGVTNVPYSRYLLHDYIAQSTGDIYADGQVRLIVEDDAHQTIGLLDIINFSPTHQRATFTPNAHTTAAHAAANLLSLPINILPFGNSKIS